MKILFYLWSAKGGGVQAVTARLANTLSERGYIVDVVVDRYTPESKGLDLLPAVSSLVLDRKGNKTRAAWRLFKAWPTETLRQLSRRLFRARNRLRLRRICSLGDHIKRHQPDIVIAPGELPIQAVWARAIAASNCRIVATGHVAKPELAPGGSTAEYLDRWLFHSAIYRRAAQHMDGFVAVSEGVRRDLAEDRAVPLSRIRTIYNPIIGDDFDTRVAELLEPLAIPVKQRSQRIILGVGRLVPAKGFDVLIRAVAGLECGESVALLILGEGDERARLRELCETLGISDRVYMPGWVSNPLPYMRIADVFVLSSRLEGSAIVLAEAMACGCPVVATDCPYGPREVLDNGRFGPLAPVDDVEGLSRAIASTLARPPAADLLEARGRSFSVSQSVDQYEAVFSQLLE